MSDDERTRPNVGPWRWLYALGAALLLGGGLWAIAQFSPGFRAAWPAWKAHGEAQMRRALLWFEFFGSLLLSALALLWLTALLFSLLLALATLLTRLLHRLASRPITRPALRRACRGLLALLERERWMGTVFNGMASAGALWLFALLTGLPLDNWDLGIQAIVTGTIELIVLGVLLREGKVNWFSRR